MATTVSPVLAAAREALASGLAPIPILADGSKQPVISWGRFHHEAPTADAVEAFLSDAQALAVVCGAASGGLECLDFDAHDAFDAFHAACEGAGLGSLLARVRAGYLERTPRGVHLFYRCEDPRTLKLARRASAAVIETKGQGGYVIVAPSRFVQGARYVLVEGGFGSIVTLTAEERADLHAVARALGEPARALEEHAPPILPDGDRPGDDWARVTDWPDILVPHGWKPAGGGRDGALYWTRPGKDAGISASTGYAGTDFLYVFTTSTVFEADRAYGKFSAYAWLEHGGDFRAAGRELRRQGFGSRPAEHLVDFDAFKATKKAKARERKRRERRKGPRRFPQHLLQPPGLVGDLAGYIVDTAPKPQPILALGAALGAMAGLCGRRVVSETGLRPNLYVCLLAESGSGKEWPRTAVRRAYRAIGQERMVSTDDVTSDAAINAVVARDPSCVLMLDEFGHLLAEARDHPSGVSKVLLKLYGAETWYGKSYAADRRGGKDEEYIVHAPCLSFVGTSVPLTFWEGLRSDDFEGGLVGRLLVLSSEDPDPDYRRVPVTRQSVPDGLEASLRRWAISEDLGYSAALGATRMPPPDPHVARMGRGAAEKLDDLRTQCRARAKELRESSRSELAALFARTPALAVKLALVVAAGMGAPGDVEITAGVAGWASELAQFSVAHLLSGARAKVGRSEVDRRVNAAAAYLEEEGLVSLSAFCRRWQRWTRRERDDVLETLEAQGRVRRLKVRTSGPRAITHLEWVEEG